MFGIDDPGIYSAYLLGIGCLVFAIIFGITHWNKEEDESDEPKNDKQ